MTEHATLITAIIGGLFYVFPKMTGEVHPNEVHIILKEGILVNAICRRKYGNRGGHETNLLNDILSGVATMTSTLVLGELTATQMNHKVRKKQWKK